MQIESMNPAAKAYEAAVKPQDTTQGGFGGMLKQAIAQVNRDKLEADQAIEGLASGQRTDIHNTMITMEKASVSFQMLMQVRNKVINAYETIMRMQV